MDSADVNRTVDGPVGINVFFLDEPGELLIENQTTNMSGAFPFVAAAVQSAPANDTHKHKSPGPAIGNPQAGWKTKCLYGSLVLE